MEQLSSLNTTEPIDFNNLNIVIHPRPPRRRQSGASLVPFRPYVKCLTSVRKPFAFANGKDSWVTMGKTEQLFKQENARCIGSLMDDCDISDVIRWDIEGESTRLPMMCKLWIIVDGAVVERGKPHLVQDAAVQVFTSGRNRHSIFSTELRYRQVIMPKIDRRRRHSWHEINEYHSVPYYQYTRSVRSGNSKGVQCDLDNEHLISSEEILPFINEEAVDEHQTTNLEQHNAAETVHNQPILYERVHVSIMTQTEYKLMDQSTETDYEFVKLFNLDVETNEDLLSSIANPYICDENISSNYDCQTKTMNRNGQQYSNKSVSTGDDYPQWWLQLSTNIVLSSYITKHGEEKEINLLRISPRQCDQSIQTANEEDIEMLLERQRTPSSTRSSNIRKSSSSMTINNHYEIIDEIDDGNNARRCLPCIDHRQRMDSHGDLDSHLSDYQIDSSSTCGNRRSRRITTSSKQSDTGYNTVTSNFDQQSYSTLDPCTIQSPHNHSISEINRKVRTKSSENTSTTVLANLVERYERTLRERQRAIAIIDNELLDIDDVLKRYREKMRNPTIVQSDRTTQLYRDISLIPSHSQEKNPSDSQCTTHLTKSACQSLTSRTGEELFQDYVPSSSMRIENSSLHYSRQRQPRFDYCDLCLNDHSTGTSWIRLNEQRIDELQKRIDLMLQNDDIEEAKFLSANSKLIANTASKRIDSIFMRKSHRQNRITYYHDRILLPYRYNFRLPYRPTQSLTTSPRLLTRTVTRSRIPASKSVRISTNHDYIPNQINLREQISSLKSISRPTVSILRRNNSNSISRSRRLVGTSHIWKSNIDGTVYILEQFSIPRYYRLYNDVNFREVYNFARTLQSYVTHNRITSKDYSSIVKSFALEQQLPTITSLA
ncbi:unnamed protein product [Rotaria magnacalcarata]|uniref:Uncharacterized protein n=1 Tax=Rotaria magnacalcarata TaxID=392030 RepID=A0A814W4N1_9BILA|nr:unnamed protein product [Rotaria magnacalcarata]CAF1532744.1 unnamed protein product [Rotaria magnacalcarata]CAF2053672.1 unnamed protein product [Rotaria magnacalcarata]CAF3947956.1 unnamed protein product [Rotaria magnacalcarata]CAF3956080.1 unnamed protein product [Rotaria magnacalcarata]